ncbi:MAG: hypothetical protein PHW95_02285 [Patescibacteria group bacterium]|nr:hypothetical protein [Patescibacteria group bacterium]
MEKWHQTLVAWGNQPFVKQLSRNLGEAEIFLVGGAVRDIIIGRPTADFDLVVRNVSIKKLEEKLKKIGRVSLVGKKFGVLKFKPKGWQGNDLDIALPRTEHSLNWSGRYRDFKITSDKKIKIEDDLSRRDFTVNALAWNIKQNKLIDPFDGLADLKAKKIRAVGKPELRFQEDYSRMLRAIRFACQLDFAIEPKTWSVIKQKINGLTKKINGEQIVPYEVIAKELTKALVAAPVKAVELLDDCGALKILIPELLKMKKCPQPQEWHSEGDVWTHNMLVLNNLNNQRFKKEFGNERPNPTVFWGALFHDAAKPQTMIKTDRIHFHGHDIASAKLFRRTAEKLKIASAGVDIDRTEQVIAKHMILSSLKRNDLKNTTVEKYFYNTLFPGKELLMVMFADVSSALRLNGKPDYTQYRKLKKQINSLSKVVAGKRVIQEPLVDGNDLIKKLGLKSGPKIGWLLKLAREAQLNGKLKNKTEALNYLKKNL